jgi:hypothetical protein
MLFNHVEKSSYSAHHYIAAFSLVFPQPLIVSRAYRARETYLHFLISFATKLYAARHCNQAFHYLLTVRARACLRVFDATRRANARPSQSSTRYDRCTCNGRPLIKPFKRW